MGSDDSVQHSELLGFWTLTIVQNSKYYQKQCFGDWMFPSSGEAGETPIQLGPLERANLNHLGPLERANSNHWTTLHTTTVIQAPDTRMSQREVTDNMQKKAVVKYAPSGTMIQVSPSP
jgi:hypothetical protein